MAELLWSAPTNVSAPVSAQTVNAAAGSLGSEYDNETNKKQFVSLELNFQHGSAPVANAPWFVYILYAQDGTNYEDGGASVQPGKLPVATFPARAVTTAQRVTISGIPILPFKFKPLVWNGTAQNSSSNAVTLNMEVFGNDDGT